MIYELARGLGANAFGLVLLQNYKCTNLEQKSV